MPQPAPLLTAKEIEDRVTALAEQITKDYRDKDLILVGVLKGAFIFLADLARKLQIPVKIDFVWYASYGDSDKSTEEILQVTGLRTDISGKDILIVEDILDTGLTMKALIAYLERFKPRSIRICAFIEKTQRRKSDIKADYFGQLVEEGFLVGYGLDYAEQFRHLPAIYELKNIISEDSV